ncbi:MAG: RagB/SusD family nutrient uptake outer membrane protein [Chitinophagaceae bacterium]
MKPFVTYIIIVTVSFTAVRCKKLIEIPAPKSQLVSSDVFSDSINATAAVLGIYTTMNSYSTIFTFGNGGITLYTGLSSDELVPSRQTVADKEFYEDKISPSNNSNWTLWINAYKIIYQINACIENVSASNALNTALKNQLTGECLFMRGFVYFNLVNLFGDVPYLTGSAYTINSVMPRTGMDSVYHGIVSDLTIARQLLTAGISPIPAPKIRPDKNAATALLARIYLYTGSFAQAESFAGDLINSTDYSLEADLNNVFTSGSNETIWSLPPLQKGFETAEGYQFIPYLPSIIPYYILNKSLLEAFEPNDLREAAWVASNTLDTSIYYYPFKYKLSYDGNSTPAENTVYLRLAEQYLIRAEARARQHNTEGALNDLNVIRSRAALERYTNVNEDSLINAINHERQIELFCECGHRWFDIKRTGTINSVLTLIKPGWDSHDTLYPVPVTEIQSNPSLQQNPGY